MGDRRDESGGRSKRKKQRRGGAAQQQRRQASSAHAHGGGKGRQQQARQQQTTGPSAAFLAALEEQRENERRREELQQLQQADEGMEAANGTSATVQIGQRDQQQQAQRGLRVGSSASAPPAAQRKPAYIAGFYYDEAQKRYFKLTPQMRQQQKQSKQQRLAREKDVVRRKVFQTSRERHQQPLGAAVGATRFALRSRLNASSVSWLGYFAERESSVGWSVGRRDQRELIPRLFGFMMPQQELRPLHVNVSESRHRITSLGFQARGSYGAMGYTGGRLEIFTVGHRSDLRSGFARQGERRIISVQQHFDDVSCQVSAVKWRPVDPSEGISDLLYACVGGDSLAESTGFVSLVRPLSSPESKWFFNDPWSIEWCPGRATRSFAVGLSGPSCAAYVDITARDGVTRAPAGKIKSDVMAQAFASDGNTILNGTRNGSTWLWDLRAGRRAHEHAIGITNIKSSSQPAGGAILDLHVLNGNFQVLVLKSNGELRLVDTRGAQRKNSSQVVVEYTAGGSNTYLPMLKCAVDDTEAVVVATGSDGRGDGMAGYVNESQSSKVMAPLEQVHLRRSSNGDAMPDIFALSRNELFASANKRETLSVQHR